MSGRPTLNENAKHIQLSVIKTHRKSIAPENTKQAFYKTSLTFNLDMIFMLMTAKHFLNLHFLGLSLS